MTRGGQGEARIGQAKPGGQWRPGEARGGQAMTMVTTISINIAIAMNVAMTKTKTVAESMSIAPCQRLDKPRAHCQLPSAMVAKP